MSKNTPNVWQLAGMHVQPPEDTEQNIRYPPVIHEGTIVIMYISHVGTVYKTLYSIVWHCLRVNLSTTINLAFAHEMRL